jgi:hypothetical protein
LADKALKKKSDSCSDTQASTTERHHAPFVKARQEQMVAAVKQAWTTMSGAA